MNTRLFWVFTVIFNVPKYPWKGLLRSIFFLLLASKKKQKKMTEKKGCGGDISNRDPAESDDTDVPGERKETVLCQIEASVLEAESPLYYKSISRAPALANVGGGNSSVDVTQRKQQLTIENNAIFEEHPIKSTGTIDGEGSGGDYRIRANETVEEHIPTKGDDISDTHLPKPRAGKLKHLLGLMWSYSKHLETVCNTSQTVGLK